MKSGKTHALRTRVYVDGYNFYYGCLEKSAHKWLDLRALAERILANVPHGRDGEPAAYELVTPAVKYFTAPIQIGRLHRLPELLSRRTRRTPR